MARTLTQKRFFIKYTTTILETKVMWKSNVFTSETEASIQYEDLSNNKDSHTFYSQPTSIVLLITLCITIISFFSRYDKDYEEGVWQFFMVLTIISLLCFIVIYRKVWKIKLSNGTYIFLLKSKPDKNEVDIFIEELLAQRRKYLKETYFHVSKNLAYEPQLKNLQWLRKIEAINGIEFKEKKNELDNLFNFEKKIGF